MTEIAEKMKIDYLSKETISEKMEQSDYNKNYYHNKYKNIIANKRSYCECCDLEFAAWNIYKHKKTKKHLINSLNEEDKKKYLENIHKDKINKKISKLQKLLT
jgi:hypothetical protein